MKKITELDLKNKTVLLRCDFNVPISKNGDILNDFRIQSVIPTIKYLIDKNAKVILMSHLETKGENKSLSLIVSRLKELLNDKIELVSDYFEKDQKEIAEMLNSNKVVLFENLRFYDQEKDNDQEFAKKLASFGDVFINEAFSVSHRNHASIVSIAQYLPKAAGLLFKKEILTLSKLKERPEQPFVIIIGGVKIKTKIKTILNLLKKSDYLLIGGKIGEAILAYKGILKERQAQEDGLIAQIDLTDKRLHLPLDGIIALKDSIDNLREGGIGTVKKQEDIYDIGPETIGLFKEVISRAKTILWNGPLGMYEDKRFEKGTKEIAQAITENKSAFKVAGGGETIMAIDKFNLKEKFNFISTGGGAMLKFLAEEKLPGIEALNHG
ncbi:MAG: phosphoglycerate kinase [Patescibacteria group bacterium]|nr:phosphoglycerate kinase [Patescibacteria group bacterium]